LNNAMMPPNTRIRIASTSSDCARERRKGTRKSTPIQYVNSNVKCMQNTSTPTSHMTMSRMHFKALLPVLNF
jgi:hypothetical protein